MIGAREFVVKSALGVVRKNHLSDFASNHATVGAT
jgi:hypothetical protein